MIRKSGPSVPARPPCGQDGTRPTVANPPATAVAVAAARALDGRRADQLSAARRAPALTELHRIDLVKLTPLERRRQPIIFLRLRHSGMVTVCRKLSAASWLWPLQEETSAKRRDARRFPRQACQRRWSCARVGGAATKAAGMMPEHSPVPPEACRGARVDDQRRTVPTSRRGASRSFCFGRFCLYPKWKSPRA